MKKIIGIIIKIIGALAVLAMAAVVVMGIIGFIRKDDLRKEIMAFNQAQEVNEDGIVIDMSGNPYFTKKQLGFDYPMPETVTYHSDITNTDRHAMVFLPAGYDEEKEYPVLYLLHGLGGSHRTWHNKSADIIIQNMYYFDDVPEMIVVCPNSEVNQESNADDLPISERIAVYNHTAAELIDNLMPYIEKHYPVKTGRKNTAIAGNSMGGRNTMYTAFSHPELFGYVGVFSSAGIFAKEGYTGIMTPLLKDVSLEKDFEYMLVAVGDNDDVCGWVSYDLHERLTKAGVEHVFYDTSGGHQNTVWQNTLYNFVRHLWK